MKIIKVISGGQTGADQGGLFAAADKLIPTGGWAPKGWKTENGSDKKLLEFFCLKESHSSDYPVRTQQNIVQSDFTILVAEKLDRGSLLTKNLCKQADKMCFYFPPTLKRIDTQRVKLALFGPFKNDAELTVNIAGNRESRSHGIFVYTRELIRVFLEEFNGNK